MALWISGFATLYTIDCVIDFYAHRRRADLFRTFIGGAIAALYLAAGTAA